MGRHRILHAAGGLVLAGTLVLAAGVAQAGVLTDPPVSSLVLAPTDLPGTTVVSQQAGRASGVESGEYEPVFKFSTPYGDSKFVEYDNAAVLFETPNFAQLTFTLLTTLLKSPAGKASLAKERAGGKGVTISALKSHAVALGDGGFELTFVATQAKPRRTMSASVLFFRVGRVVETGTAIGTGAPPQAADSLALATLALNRARAALVPGAVTPPAIVGTAQQGQLLAASPGTWTDAPTAYAYQWQHCDGTGANCTDIPGATTFTYSVTAADVGTTLRVNVTATGSDGTSSPVSSAVTAVVS